jgi:Protein of unknown function (DUF3108)
MQGTQQRRQDTPTVRFEPEELNYTLSYADRTAGTMRWTAQLEKGMIVVRLEANFTGIIGQGVRRVQTSKIDPYTRLPIQFTENNGQGGHHFEVNFDRRSGLVTVKQNRDEASQALTQDYHDPLSIIQLLREMPDDATGTRVPMIGGSVVIARLPDEIIETHAGPKLARVFYLRPGVGLVYLDAQAPHRPLRFSQAVGKFMLEAVFTRAGVVAQGARIGDSMPQASQNVRQDRGRGQQNQPRSRNAQMQQKPAQTKTGGQGPRSDQPPRGKPNPQPQAQTSSPKPPSGDQPDGGGRRRRRRFRRRGKGGGGEGGGGEGSGS